MHASVAGLAASQARAARRSRLRRSPPAGLLLVAEPLGDQLAEDEPAPAVRAGDQQAGAAAAIAVLLEQPVAEPLEVLARVCKRAVGCVRARGRGQGFSCHCLLLP